MAILLPFAITRGQRNLAQKTGFPDIASKIIFLMKTKPAALKPIAFFAALSALCTLCIVCTVAAGAGQLTPAQLANPLQGTDTVDGFSHGGTYPAIALPFPMNTWAPYTQPQKNSFYYQYRKNTFRGIRQTHQPSVWIPEYAAFSLMPVSGKLVFSDEDRASTFSHANEIAQPGYYKARLDTWDATIEVTPTERCAVFRFTFDKPRDAYVILDLFKCDEKKPSIVEIVPGENKIIGVARNNLGATPGNFGNYFVIVFDQPFVAGGVWNNDKSEAKNRMEGARIGAYVKFDPRKTPVITCRVASSFISAEQAALNLKREIGGASFETIRQRAEERWNEMLGRARVEGGTEEQQRTFYSALYRSILFPHRFNEEDASGKPIYYSPYDGKLHKGYMFTDSGYWDTFRSAHPLYNLLYPEISGQITQGILNAYRESGWLPQWSSPGNRNAMIGNHAFSILADAWVKNVRAFDVKEAVNAMIHDAHNRGGGMGRHGYEYYDRLGYVPVQTPEKIPDATSKTLEYAYDDYCAAILAHAAGRDAEAARFTRASKNYANVYDASTGFMRGRKEDGSWREPFDPYEWGGPFVEGNAWQWTWSVMHDVPALIKLSGGDEAFSRKLDALFAAPPIVKPGSYGHMIHEMNEMVAQGFGQYAHGNEPVHHVAYLYNYAGQPWKTQLRVRQIMSQLYQSTPDGLSGDEDTGQMSAWYVFNALGFYPVCPGTDIYAIGSPIFDRATLTVGKKQFIINARDNGPQRPYIKAARLNGEPYDKTWLTHGQIAGGGEITFEMTSFPEYRWGSDAGARPPSPTAEQMGR